MLLIVGILTIVAVPTILTLIVSAFLKKLSEIALFCIATFMLPTVAFIAGAALMVWFQTLTLDPGDGGNGPAFFGVLFVMVLLPLLLAPLGALSGAITVILIRIDRQI